MRKQSEKVKNFRRYLRARMTGFYVTTSEEGRVEKEIALAGSSEGYHVRFWDCATGCRDLMGQTIEFNGSETAMGVLSQVRSCNAEHERVQAEQAANLTAATIGTAPQSLAHENRILWILKDLPELFPTEGPELVRAVRSLVRDLQREGDPGRYAVLVLLTVRRDIPDTLREELTYLDWPLPDREEMATILREVVVSNHHIPEELEASALPQALKEMGGEAPILDAAAGLSSTDAQNAFALSLVKNKKLIAGQQRGIIVPSVIALEKKRIIERDGLLQWHEPSPRGLDGVGGLRLLKEWLQKRARGFSPAARSFGLPNPRGVLLLGPSGTGKSLTAKAVATAFQLPLIRMDLGALKGSLVGQSEANIRKALKTVEAIRHGVLWIDEFDKALAGARRGLDSGVSADQLGTLLTWREEFQGGILLIATGNDPSAIPPEMQARFDAAFFVDLPHRGERIEILERQLERVNASRTAQGSDRKLATAQLGLAACADLTDGFSGRELAHVVDDALFQAFDAGRELAAEDLLTAARSIVPGSKSSVEQVDALRAWGKSRARPASAPEAMRTLAAIAGGRTIDTRDEEI